MFSTTPQSLVFSINGTSPSQGEKEVYTIRIYSRSQYFSSFKLCFFSIKSYSFFSCSTLDQSNSTVPIEIRNRVVRVDACNVVNEHRFRVQQISNLQMLHKLSLQSNYFNGTIHSSLSNLNSFITSLITWNRLSGELPYNLTGAIPARLGEL